jgi:glutamine amidotransferase
LGILPGKCLRFPVAERVPQIGWNQISIKRKVPILAGVPEGTFFYFVHSFYVETVNESDCVATTDYGLDYTSVAGDGRIFGVQFHPEKSQTYGLRLLDNFARLN